MMVGYLSGNPLRAGGKLEPFGKDLIRETFTGDHILDRGFGMWEAHPDLGDHMGNQEIKDKQN